jgi:protein-disulfide isomerase
MRLYVINFATPILALVAGALKAPSPTGRDLGVGVAVFALLSTFAVGGQRAYRATLLGDSGSALVEAKKSGGGAKAMDHDPEGPAPVLTFQVKTEDGNDKTLRTRATDPWKGNPDAKVAIVEFADFECGYCKRASSQLRRLYEAYGDRIVFVYKHFPMDPACNPGVNNRRHGDACNAAAASVCAQDQGKFWQFHDIAFKNQHELDPDDLELYAKTVGLDLEKFRSCVRDEKTLARVKESAADGAEIESHGTPRIWINGRLYRAGASAEQMASEIARALNEAPQAFAEDDEAPFQPIPADVPTMRHVSAGGLDFWIDTFEASLVDGKAHVGKHEIPATRMSWFAARDACEAAGKHVCTEQEWTAACQGAAPVDDDADGQFADDMIEGTTYPYGDFNDPRRCWSDKGKEGFRPVYTGEMPGCISKDGVYDLAGNVEEWVGTTPENAVLLGGAYDTADDKARCFRRNDTFGAGYAHLRTGFRCCAPTNVP